MLTGTASSPETSDIRISLESEDGIKKWSDLDLGNVLLFSNLFSRCFFSIISVVGTQNDWTPGISEMANSNRDLGDNICSVTDRCKFVSAAIRLIVPSIPLHEFLACDVAKKCYSAYNAWSR